MMFDSDYYYKRNLPHYQPPDATFFITFRLAGTLPIEIIQQLRAEREEKIKRIKSDSTIEQPEAEIYKIHKRFFGKFDHLLDQKNYGPTWLICNDIAQLIADAIHHRDGTEYRLITFCIMPNHVHMVVDNVRQRQIKGRHGLSLTLQALKRYTGKAANRILNLQGKQFWHRESYDHVVRGQSELSRIIRYVINNPVKAGLVTDWVDWKWTYLAPE